MIVHPFLVLMIAANAALSSAVASTAFESGPVELNRSNSEVTFTVDSTWHEIHGTVGDVRGKVWLERPADLSSLKVDVQLPVGSFDTDNGRRDTRMREVLLAEQFPDVHFEGALQPGC
ncbi:MAG: YceI family protein, partial [Deltaproteobacteria bacterium]|nr:YceI family protein [Deltaproteobacteria bacterium]